MDPAPMAAPDFGLPIFLGLNYVVGYGAGIWLTGSTAGAIGIALVAPCLSLLGIALFAPAQPMPPRRIEG